MEKNNNQGGGIPDEDIPKMEYQRLFDVISETGGIAFQTEMQEIIRIVHEDFPSEEISRLKAENERLRGRVEAYKNPLGIPPPLPYYKRQK